MQKQTLKRLRMWGWHLYATDTNKKYTEFHKKDWICRVNHPSGKIECRRRV